MERFCERHGFGTRFTTSIPNEKVKATHARSVETLFRGWKIEYLCEKCCNAGLHTLDRYSRIFDSKELIHGLPDIPT